MTIAGKTGQKQLAAIAGRAQISESVTNVLVERGDAAVSRKVSANLGARISETGFVKLINKAKKDRELATAISSRSDLPEELVPFLKLGAELRPSGGSHPSGSPPLQDGPRLAQGAFKLTWLCWSPLSRGHHSRQNDLGAPPRWQGPKSCLNLVAG